ncbi:alanine--tRNA ligase [Oceanicella actignis]|uniref:alanine--tRNA ligase n=1 Tax=Oceanicella actignis TaxID=1189325 RepID=UPI0011E6EB5C|nr:alanine--tRNA ligase [Oceanicella actignis]TYO91495.1 alanyl-tRNA synthetase [Oceanicella actignis]
MISGNQIRSEFLNFFKERDHEIVDSSPIVPRNDPTLMFVNSGMVQFKNVFTGVETRPYSRAATSQKCVRAGGKHNDLDNVGYTARHHTFFEMLGNFSFGDYFKDVAIEQAWTLSTKVFGLPPEKLLVTVHASDDEAAALWRKIAGLPEERIIRINSDDNWWRMGDTGPNGPCTELFYDHGPEVPGGPPGSPDEDGDRFVEFWNLVFMQYETHEDGSSTPLPRPSVDTGMGLERMTTILQGVHNNYDTDLFQPIIRACAELTGQAPDGPMVVSHRVVADHLRCAAFLIAEGVLPSNEGRGYVLRRIMRRGMRHAHMLGAREPLLHRLAPALIDLMGGHYVELRAAEPLIRETLRAEEERFKALLERGLRLLDAELERLDPGAPLPGETAFKLYDTYGFPLDLTQDILRGKGAQVDVAGYEAAMAAQKAAARAAWAGTGDAGAQKLWFDIRDRVGPTEFLGYQSLEASGRVLALVRDGAEVAHAAIGETFELVANQTPFYAEQGGQAADRGVIEAPGGVRIEVLDVQKRADGVFAHLCRIAGDDAAHVVNVGDTITLRVDPARRAALCAHHSATHLLHEALRRRLGDHVAQKGSLVEADRLRFDISHGKPLTAEDVAAVEREVNARIRACTPVETRVMPLDEARESGARALFGEKYGDEVRVVSMGGRDPGQNRPWSIELCGGTHVANTGQIGFFKILREEGLAAGVRRVEAVAHEAAEAHVARLDRIVSGAAATLHAQPDEIEARLSALLAERRALENELSETRRKLAAGGAGGAPARKLGEATLTLRVVEGMAPRELKAAADEILAAAPGVAALATRSDDGKGSIVVAVSRDFLDKVDAVTLVRAAAPHLGAKGGGGRPEMAQTGGPDGAGVEAALKAVEEAAAAALG